MSDTPLHTDSLTPGSQADGVLPLQQQPTRRSLVLPRPTAEHLKTEVDKLSRAPFGAALARFMSCEPSPKAIRLAAKRSPDRWVQSLTQLARLAGYHDKLELDLELTRVADLSDSELDSRIARVLREQSSLTVQSHETPCMVSETDETGETGNTDTIDVQSHDLTSLTNLTCGLAETETETGKTPSGDPHSDVALLDSTDGNLPK